MWKAGIDEMNTKKILTYLSDLEGNNNREWYHAHKEQLQEANAEFLKLIEALISEIGKTDTSILNNSPKDLTFKLVRDTRFSYDKSPYNPTFRAHISTAGKLPIPVGYFISIRPGNRSFLGGGLFADMFKDATDMIRTAIAEHGDEFERIITEPDFAKHFTVMGETLKNVPKGYPSDHTQAKFLKYKSWFLEYSVPDLLISDPKRFLNEAVDKFVLMQPFNAFLNRALSGFQMPAR